MPKRSTLRLTTRSVAALPATGRDAVYWDGDLAGFGVRVQRNGRKVYVVQSRGPAGLKRVTLGPVAGKVIDQRRRQAAEVVDRIKRGLDPLPPEPEPDPTVADLAERCMRAYVKVHCKPKTESLYRTAIDLHIVPALGEGLPIIGRLLGHRRMETTARYAHLDRKTVRKSAERVASRIAGYLLC